MLRVFSVKKWLLPALLMIAVGLAAGAAEAAETAPPKKEKKQAIHPADEGAPKAKETGGFGGQKVYVSIGPIILPVITDAGPQQIITMVVSLQVKDTNGSDKVRAQLPRLIDAYMRALYGKLDGKAMHHGRIINIEFLKEKISAATQEILGNEVVEDVLIQAVAQRPV